MHGSPLVRNFRGSRKAHLSLLTMDNLNTLTAFRQAAYDCFTQAQDALFELTDAIMLTPAANSFVELSLSPVFRRRWPSVYEAIDDAAIDQEALLRLYLAHRPEGTVLTYGLAASFSPHVVRAHLRTSSYQDQRQQTHHDWFGLLHAGLCPCRGSPDELGLAGAP